MLNKLVRTAGFPSLNGLFVTEIMEERALVAVIVSHALPSHQAKKLYREAGFPFSAGTNG